MKYLCFFFIFTISPAFAGEKSLKDLAYSKEWLSLGHYQSKILGGYESTIETTSFFVDENGRDNPEKELFATIELFKSKKYEQRCRFPARYEFLKKHQLVIDDSFVCEEFEAFKNDLKPSGITFIFTDAYMNNPSSLFGHTLLRVDTSKKGSQLLAHGVNYGANVDEKKANPVLFAVLGLTGGYSGGFTVKPYYNVINMYNNIENRDIWEYELDFSNQEVDFFVAHLWELGQTQTSYYFFTRNCSYMILELLDAVRPELELSKEFAFQTIPMDTLKAVALKEGLVKNVNYRSSRQNQIYTTYKQMSVAQKEYFLNIINEQDYENSSLNQRDKAQVLEVAYQYLQYQNVEQKIVTTEYRTRSFRLLKERNALKVQNFDEPKPKGERPDESHNSMRSSLSTGFRNGEAFQEVAYRPAYHSLVDNGYGYLKGAEINFLNVSARHYDSQNKYVLNRFDIVSIRSISPISHIFKPISYDVDININREMNPYSQKEGYVFNSKLGAGGTFEIWQSLYVFSKLNGYFSYGGFIEQNQWSGVAPSVGLLFDLGKFRFLGEAQALLATSKFAPKSKYNLEASYSLSRNLSLGINYLYYDNYGHNLDEAKLGIRYHF